jgi:hypothetical protein
MNLKAGSREHRYAWVIGTGVMLLAALGFLARSSLSFRPTNVAASPRARRYITPVGLAFLSILGLGLLLRAIVLFGHDYPPGGDYGHLLLYTHEIVEKGEVPIYFPYHQLGETRFLSSPGLPLLLSALSFMTGLESVPLAYYALLLSTLQIATVFVFVRLLAGNGPALLGSLFLAIMPVNLEILAWAGYSNIYALALLPLLAWALIQLRRSRSLGWTALVALLTVGIGLGHHLSALIAILMLGGFVVIDLALSRFQPRAVASYVLFGSAALALGLPVLIHTLDTYFGADAAHPSLQGASMASTKLDFDVAMRFFTPIAIVLAWAGLVRLVFASYSGAGGRLVVLALSAACALLAYAWVFSVNLYYERALYFAAIVVAAAAACAVWRTHAALIRPLLITAIVGYLVATGLTHAVSSSAYYSILTRDSYNALTWVRDTTQEDDVVLTDYCSAFLLEFVSQRPTVAAFPPELLASSEEAAVAADARVMLLDGRSQRALFDKYGIDYVVFDARCPEFNASLVLANLDSEPFLTPVIDFGPVTVYRNLRAVAGEAPTHVTS